MSGGKVKHETIGERICWVRSCYALSMKAFGLRVNVGTSYVSKLESGASSAPSRMLLSAICDIFAVRPEWLANGEGDPFLWKSYNDRANKGEKLVIGPAFGLIKEPDTEAQSDAPRDPLLDVMLMFGLHGAAQQPASVLAERILLLGKHPAAPEVKLQVVAILLEQLLARLRRDESGEGLTLLAELVNSEEVKAWVPVLIKRVQALTSSRGSKAKLAAHLGVPPASLSQWLAGTREPGGENTLRMLRWVEREDRKAATVCNPSPG